MPRSWTCACTTLLPSYGWKNWNMPCRRG